MTIAERLRGMTDEEMAIFFEKKFLCAPVDRNDCSEESNCVDCFYRWINTEYNEREMKSEKQENR